MGFGGIQDHFGHLLAVSVRSAVVVRSASGDGGQTTEVGSSSASCGMTTAKAVLLGHRIRPCCWILPSCSPGKTAGSRLLSSNLSTKVGMAAATNSRPLHNFWSSTLVHGDADA